jgi:hypothetical protein
MRLGSEESICDYGAVHDPALSLPSATDCASTAMMDAAQNGGRPNLLTKLAKMVLASALIT